MTLADKDAGAQVFDDPAIELARKFLSEYVFWLKGIDIPIRIRLYEAPSERGVYYQQSHFIRAPGQADAYRTSRPWGDTEEWALSLAISGFTQFYNSAIASGHEPADSWLVANIDFH